MSGKVKLFNIPFELACSESLSDTANKSVPSVLNCFNASLVTNSPPNTIATTDAVPTKIPNNANKERSLEESKFAKPSWTWFFNRIRLARLLMQQYVGKDD